MRMRARRHVALAKKTPQELNLIVVRAYSGCPNPCEFWHMQALRSSLPHDSLFTNETRKRFSMPLMYAAYGGAPTLDDFRR